MRFFKISIVFLLVLLVSGAVYAKPKGDIEFSLIEVDEGKEYGKNDAVSVKIRLKNTGKENIFVNKRFYINSDVSDKREREVYFTAASSDGERLKYRQEPFDTGLPRADDFRLLKPGDEVASKYDRNLRAYFDFVNPGEYEIQAVYENVFGSEIGLDVFKKKLTSNTIKVKIVD